MAIGTPTSLGSNTTATAGSIALVGSSVIHAGDLVVVGIGIYNDTTTVSSVSDGTNTYVLGNAISNSGNNRTEIWYKENASAVASPTITATFAGSATTPAICAATVSGIAASGSKDQSATGQGLSAAYNAGPTGLLSQVSEIALGFSISRGASSQAVGTGFTALVPLFTGNSSNGTYRLDYQTVSATTALTYTGSLNTTTNYSANILTFKALSGVSITGVSGTGSAGTAQGEVDKPLTGVSGTGSAGIAVGNVRGSVSGASGTGGVGSLAISKSFAALGVSGTGTVGALFSGVAFTVAGVSGIGTAGIIGPGVTLRGVQGIGSAHDVYPIPPAPTNRAPLLIPVRNGLPASLWLGNPNNGG